ncbi:Retrovirus-related Pol polyprotein from transposon RE1 [Senna tora]|uniref:Retrovirus-related Pol polyprotein from transposon RE1 n=1 Tax=Senna tora TaxID=362788 RepID=A0A834VYL2_9FABA|nr:Retrovirus-related Pol polyprotein from transposon RE1 [Senna tora]
MHCQDTPSDPHSHGKGNTAPNLAISNVCPNEILSPPIVKRKGVRTCTLHPISQFVSYEKLSPKFQAFVSNLDKEVIKKQRYSQSQSDHTLFFKRFPGNLITILIVYVDDIIVTGNCEKEVERLKGI